MNPFRAGIDVSRQNLTSINVTSKVDPRTVGVKMFTMAVGIQMKQKIEKYCLFSMVYTENTSAF